MDFFLMFTFAISLASQHFHLLLRRTTFPFFVTNTDRGKEITQTALMGWLCKGLVFGDSLLVVHIQYLHYSPREFFLKSTGKLDFSSKTSFKLYETRKLSPVISTRIDIKVRHWFGSIEGEFFLHLVLEEAAHSISILPPANKVAGR